MSKKGGKPHADVDAWLKGAEEVAGSWWPFRMEWMRPRPGQRIPAPGFYVLDEA